MKLSTVFLPFFLAAFAVANECDTELTAYTDCLATASNFKACETEYVALFSCEGTDPNNPNGIDYATCVQVFFPGWSYCVGQECASCTVAEPGNCAAYEADVCELRDCCQACTEVMDPFLNCASVAGCGKVGCGTSDSFHAFGTAAGLAVAALGLVAAAIF